jgi:hypothetical protein
MQLGWSVHPDTNAIYGLASAPKLSNDKVHFLGEFESLNACWCEKAFIVRRFVVFV